MAINLEVNDPELRRLIPVIRSLRAVCLDLEVDFYIIGAFARDLYFQHLHGTDVPRTTRDVDVAVAVDAWDSYEAVRNLLITDYNFTDEEPKQRVRSPEAITLDLVPFGGIEDPSGQIRFPPDDRPTMTTLGLEEAQRTTTSFNLDDEISVEVASLPGLGLLKLIAWDERPRERTQDAQDLGFILREYFDAYANRIVENHNDLFDDDVEVPLASARAYGREIAPLLVERDVLREHVVAILERETNDVYQSDLADAMNAPGCYQDYDRRFDSIVALLEGIRESIN